MPRSLIRREPLGLHDMLGTWWEWVADCTAAGCAMLGGSVFEDAPTRIEVGADRRNSRFFRDSGLLRCYPGRVDSESQVESIADSACRCNTAFLLIATA